MLCCLTVRSMWEGSRIPVVVEHSIRKQEELHHTIEMLSHAYFGDMILVYLHLLALACKASTSRLPVRLFAHKTSALACHLTRVKMGGVVFTSGSFIVYRVAGGCVRPPMLSLALPNEAGSWQVAAAIFEMLRKSHYVIMHVLAFGSL
jgi:hypothetical protein